MKISSEIDCEHLMDHCKDLPAHTGAEVLTFQASDKAAEMHTSKLTCVGKDRVMKRLRQCHTKKFHRQSTPTSQLNGVLTLLDDGEELVCAGILEAAAGPEVFGKTDDASDVQGDAQRHIVHVQLSTQRQAHHVINCLVQHLEDTWETPPAAQSCPWCMIPCPPLSQQ